MALKMNSAGGGSLTLQEPNTASNLTLTLPAATGTLLYSDGSNVTTVPGNLTLSGTAARIRGDFSNATAANRVGFQTSTTNGNTYILALPNGTGNDVRFQAYNNSDTTNSAFASFGVVGSTDVRVQSSTLGSGTALPMTFYTGGSERMRIDTSGNVGIGTSSPQRLLHVAGTSRFDGEAMITSGASLRLIESSNNNSYLLTNVGNNLTFVYNSTERMRIDNSGNLLVGCTDNNRVGSVGVRIGAASTAGNISSTKAASTNADDTFQVYSTGASAYRFYVRMDGVIAATNTTITAISDKRYKENIRDLDVGLDAVMALKPRKFDWKEGKGKDIKDDRGFIAQEFEQVFPDLIDEWKDPAPEGEEPYKSVRQDLIPVLVKAIQELKAELDATKAEVAVLKSAS